MFPSQHKVKSKISQIQATIISIVFLIGSLPFLLNYFVDPYGLFASERRGGKLAQKIERAHYPLWKLAKLKPFQNDVFILGDSRARALQEKYWHEFGRQRVVNLAYGGGTIPEIYSTFKIIKEDPNLQTLIVGMQLRSFDEDHKQGMNRVPEALRLVNQPIEYLKNWTVFKTSLDVFQQEHMSLSKAAAATPPLPKKFADQIKRNGRADWQDFQVSEKYWKMITEIGNWAKANKKQLIFVIPPTISQMQATIANAGLTSESQSMRKRLAGLGLVLDFDIPGNLTSKISNFSDAYHFKSNIGRMIVGEILKATGAEQRILKRIEKRRGEVTCPFSKGQCNKVKGKNCRIFWG